MSGEEIVHILKWQNHRCSGCEIVDGEIKPRCRQMTVECFSEHPPFSMYKVPALWHALR